MEGAYVMDEQPIAIETSPVFELWLRRVDRHKNEAGRSGLAELDSQQDCQFLPWVDLYRPPSEIERSQRASETLRLELQTHGYVSELEIVSPRDTERRSDREFFFDTQEGVNMRYIHFVYPGLPPPDQWFYEAKYARIPDDIALLNEREARQDLDRNSCDPCGVFFANYGAHGTEFVSISETEDEHGVHWYEGLKITGDPNVPAGEVSFRVEKNALRLESMRTALYGAIIDRVSGQWPGGIVTHLHAGTSRMSRHGYVSPRDSPAWMLCAEERGACSRFAILFANSGAFQFHRLTTDAISQLSSRTEMSILHRFEER